MKGVKNMIYISLTLGMLLYAVPRLEIGQGFTLPTVFGIAWIGMALLIIAAHLHHILGVDEETSREMSRVRQFKKWHIERMIKRKMDTFQSKKS